MTAHKNTLSGSPRGVPGILRWTAIVTLSSLTIFETSLDAFAGKGKGIAVWTAKPVKGVVVDENGQPVPNATVTIKGTGRATTTDVTGAFTITAEQGDVLVFTSVATETQEQRVGKAEHLLVTLGKKDKSLDEVVVVGYGQAKSVNSVVGSIDQVTSKVIQDRPVADVFDGLQGRIPGLSILSSSGEPSSFASLSINGMGSLTADVTPLIVVDGIQVSQQSLFSMNPNDIATLSVLRDASATSIYGARAANGVIFITTKKGVVGQDQISVSEQFGYSSIADSKYFKQFMSATQLANFQVQQGLFTQGEADTLLQQYPSNTEWYKYYYKDHAPHNTTQLAFSGATPKTNYYVSGSYTKDEGVAYRSNFDRYTFRTNLSSKINEWVTFGVNLSGGYNVNQTNPSGSNSTNRGLYFLAPSYYSPIDPTTGKEYPTLIPGWGRYNPKYRADELPNPVSTVQLDPTGFLDIHPFKGLTFRSQGGMDFYDSRNTSQQLPSFQASPGDGSTAEAFNRESKTTFTNTLEYNFKVAGEHSITFLAGTEYVDDKYFSDSAASTGQTDDRLTLLNDGPSNISVSSYNSEYKYISYFGRVNYAFRNKYNLEGSFRNDASSLFGANVRNANFWSAGANWDAKREDFLDHVSWLSELKILASIGTAGNSAISPYQTLDLTGVSTYGGATGWFVSSAGNANLTWEKVTTTTVGAQFSLFNRAHFDLHYYDKHTKDMLLAVPYPFTSGFSSVTSNIGTLKNSGLDARFNVDIVRTKDLLISPFVTLTANSEKVTQLFQGLKYYILPNTGVLWAVGKPQSFIYPIYAGVNPTDGNPQWYVPGSDITTKHTDPKNVTESFNPDSLQQNTGKRVDPPVFGGFGLDASYKGLSLAVQFAFYSGKWIINNDEYFYANPNIFPGFNQSTKILNYWTTPGQNAAYPSLANQTWTQFDSRLIEKANFVRMKLITLAYTLPQNLLGNTRAIKGIKLYVEGRNLLTFTKYPGVDPEVNSNLELGSYPNTKQITFGLNVTL
jgi:TonB-linked SusC/RagA family outer membrane protein